jgi:hypothetical protein
MTPPGFLLLPGFTAGFDCITNIIQTTTKPRQMPLQPLPWQQIPSMPKRESAAALWPWYLILLEHPEVFAAL